jgi:hypothetical protein
MADLHIIGSGGIEFNGFGMIYRRTTPTAVVGAGGINFAGTGVIAFKTPGLVVGAGGVEFGGDGVIEFITPPLVLGSGGIEFGGQGIISFLPPKVTLHVGAGGIQFSGQGVIGVNYPRPVPVLAIVGSGGMVFGGTGVVATSKPPVLAIIGSGGIQFGEFRVAELTVVKVVYPADLTLAAITGAGGVEFGGTGVITFSKPQVYATPIPQTVADANIFFGGSGIIAFIHPQILQVIGDGGVIFGGEPVEPGVFETYVLTGARGEPSIYSDFDFNSYAKYRGQYFGAGKDGIYLLEGEDDDGKEIHSGVRIGPANFGTDREKRLRLLRCGGKTTEAQVKVSNGNGSAGYYDVEDGRAAVSREVQGREITIEIADFETLDHLEIVPTVLAKR